jgi:hypothetical protein
MSKNPYVLKALKILGLEEMLKLAEILKSKQVPMKKVAGEDLIVWSEPEASEEILEAAPPKVAKVLNFPGHSPKPEPEAEETKESKKEETNQPHLVTAEMMLWQKELTKESDSSLQKQDAFNGYKKSTEMYVVKTEVKGGKDKMRIASTQGVLVNKKQA